MKNPKPLSVLFGAILLFFVLISVIPWQALIMIVFVAIILFALLKRLQQQFAKERSMPILQYQPPPRTNPPLGFDLSSQEYQQISKGYQMQHSEKPTKTQKDAIPKQEHPRDYDQPQAHYPQQQ